MGCFSIALTGTLEEACYFAAEAAFFTSLRASGFRGLNGALVAAVDAVLLRSRQDVPGL